MSFKPWHHFHTSKYYLLPPVGGNLKYLFIYMHYKNTIVDELVLCKKLDLPSSD